MTDHQWKYRARLVEIIDGDTMDFIVDLGFNITRKMRIRLKNVDTAETYGVEKGSEEYQKGMEHKQYAAKWFNGVSDSTDAQWPLYLVTYKDSTGKYGRYLARVEARESDTVTLLEGTDVAPDLTDALVNEYPEVLSE